MNNATFEVIQPLLKLLLTIQTESDYFPVSSNRYFKGLHSVWLVFSLSVSVTEISVCNAYKTTLSNPLPQTLVL